MNIEHVYKYATNVANLAFADLEQKEQIRDSLLILITNACVAYDSDPKFREEVKLYRRYAKNKQK